MVCFFFVLDWVYYVLGFFFVEIKQKTRDELSVERHLEVYKHYCSIIRLGGAAQHPQQGKGGKILQRGHLFFCKFIFFGDIFFVVKTAWRKMDEEMKLCASEAKGRASAAIAQAALARESADQAREFADEADERAIQAQESAQHAVLAATRAEELLQAWLRGACTGASSGSSGISSTA
jgi:hypothetical protein